MDRKDSKAGEPSYRLQKFVANLFRKVKGINDAENRNNKITSLINENKNDRKCSLQESEDDVENAKMDVVEGGATADTEEEEEILRYDNAVSSSSAEVLPQKNEQDGGGITEEHWYYSGVRDELGNPFWSSEIGIEQVRICKLLRLVSFFAEIDQL